jgi:transcription elongation factor Elf1
MTDKPRDYPLDEILKGAAEKIAEGWTVHQKFTCVGCGNRLTVEEPNEIHATGTCDNCDAVTDIRKQGCNYMLVRSLNDVADLLRKA